MRTSVLRSFVAELEKRAFTTSQYSGPLSMGSFKQESGQPGYNTAQALKVADFEFGANYQQDDERDQYPVPKKSVPLKKESGYEDDYFGDGGETSHNFKQESSLPPLRKPKLKVAGALTPAGRLASSRAVGLPKITAPSGPSIAQQSKPHGFGHAMPGAIK